MAPLFAQTASKTAPKIASKSIVKANVKPAPLNQPVPLVPQGPPPALVIESGTPVFLETHIAFDSKYLKEGEMVCVHLKFPVQVAGKTIIPAGQQAYCRINRLIRPGGGGKEGLMELEPMHFKTATGQIIFLSGNPVISSGRGRAVFAQALSMGTGALGNQLGNIYAMHMQAQQLELQTKILEQQFRNQQALTQQQNQTQQKQLQVQEQQIMQQMEQVPDVQQVFSDQSQIWQQQNGQFDPHQNSQQQPGFQGQIMQNTPSFNQNQTGDLNQIYPSTQMIPESFNTFGTMNQAANLAQSVSPISGVAPGVGLLHASAILSVVSPFITLLIKGKRAVIPEGYTMRAFIAYDVVIPVK